MYFGALDDFVCLIYLGNSLSLIFRGMLLDFTVFPPSPFDDDDDPAEFFKSLFASL